jgi:hypothetical protein
MSRLSFLFLVLTAFIFSPGCDTEEEPIPSYIKVNPIQLSTTTDEGSNSHKIEYAFIYINEEFLGGYFIPSTIPILQEGDVTIQIDPGVKANGLSFNPDIYPFYQRYEANITLTPGEVTEINPTTKYRENCAFPIQEEFNSTSHIFTADIDENPSTVIEISTLDAFEGTSGRIELTSANPSIIFGSDFNRNDLRSLPDNGTAVWLEVNFKGDTEIIFGLIAIDDFGNPESFPEYGINRTSTWNKVYFDLSQIIRDPRFVAFQVFGGATLPSGATEATVLLDNIKLVHFEF